MMNQSGDLLPFTEIVPASASFSAPERSSILTSRRRVRVVPQTGPSLGAAGAGGGNQQVQFLIADQGGLLDLRSVCLNYTILTSGAALPTCDDGHPFSTVQVLLNGQLLENVQSAAKLANVNAAMGMSQSYYKSAGSMQGFELLNHDLVTTSTANIGYGNVALNQPSCQARTSRVAAPVFNNIAGKQVSIPLAMVCDLGLCPTYIPIALIGELSIVLQSLSANEALFSITAASTVADYSLSNMAIEYDIIVPDPRYFALLQKIATEEGPGLVIPFQSSIVSTGAIIPTSASLTETSIIVSRATNNLLKSNVVFVPTSQISALGYPSQSCFGHAGVYSMQWRIGSQVYPQTAAQGDASLFNMSLLASGSVMQENGTVINRCLFANSTNAAVVGTSAVFETAELATGGTTKFAFGDRFIPSYGFQTVKGGSQNLTVDGVSVAGASGSQIIVSVISAGGTNYTPYVVTTGLKFVVAKQGGVSVVGA